MDKSKIAYHEAGHVVIARVLGVGVHSVTASPVSDYRAAAIIDSAVTEDIQKTPELFSVLAALKKDVMVNFAGPAAQRKYKPVRYSAHPREWPLGSWRSDYNAARRDVRWVVVFRNTGPDDFGSNHVNLNDSPDDLTQEEYDEAERLMEEWWKEAGALVEMHWPAIQRVAEALLKRPTLNQDEIDALVQYGAGPPKCGTTAAQAR